jgi:predicted metal-binding protein
LRKTGGAIMEDVKIGIIICNRYHTCAGGKCFRAAREREGAFSIYKGKQIEIVGYTTCDGCPGGNIEYAPAEMKKNGATVVHLATGLVVGYPPCPRIAHFKSFIKEKFGLDVVVGTHPIPQKYYVTHTALETWNTPAWEEHIKPTLTDEKTRLAYD